MQQNSQQINDSPPRPLYVGLDVGGTKIAALAVDSRLTPCGEATVPTATSSPDALVASIEDAVGEALGQAGADRAALQAIGGGIPGQIDHRTGYVRNAVNLGLQQYALGAALIRRFNCPVVLENDVRLAAFGTYRFLRRRDPARFSRLESLVYISIGTGLAAGLVLNGRLYRGARGMAGELGHLQLDPDGYPCNCGARGCAEQYISGPGLVRLAQTRLPELPASALHDLDSELSARAIFGAATTGDMAAKALVDEFAQWVARLLYATALVYDAECLALGGGVVQAGTALLAPVMQHVEQLRTDNPLARSLLHPDHIEVMSHQNMGAWGGIVLATDARLNEEKKHHAVQLRVAVDQEQPLS